MVLRLDGAFKALGDLKRLRILKLLEGKHLCVCELAFVLGVSQPAVSRHLKRLISAGFVDCEQDGYWTNYFLNPKSEYAKVLLVNLRGWLGDDEVVRADLVKVKKANRKKLCCK
ncbi:MAG: metalloregulator ArsR/SmtB family transcription factor [Candidatus Bathyarchaeota archaeon]